MLNCNASPAPGTKTTSTDVEQPLTTEEHIKYTEELEASYSG